MSALRVLVCSLALFGLLRAQAQELAAFPSRDTPVSLVNTDGVRIEAVINDVLPQRQSARITVPEQNRTFELAFSTLDEPSQQVLQTWFFKRIASLNLSVSVEEKLLGRNDIDVNKYGIPEPPANALNKRQSQHVREKNVSVTIRNTSNYPLEGLDVVIGTLVNRDVSGTDASARARFEREVRTWYNGVSIRSGVAETLESTPVQLLTYSMRYDIETTLAIVGGGTTIQTDRYRIQSADRIAAYYVLVYYGEELVSMVVSQNYLSQILSAKDAANWNRNRVRTGKTETIDEPFGHSGNRVRSTP